jgi:uncharacterized protein (TIGR02246 family)
MVIPLVLLAAACKGAAPTLTEQQTAAIADTVRQAADAYMRDIRALDFERVNGAYSADLVWAENGVLAVNRDSLTTAWRQVFATWRTVTRGEWKDIRVRVLGPDAAVITAGFDLAAQDTAGAPIGTRGVWTAVYVRTDAGWKIAYAHESYVSVASQQ